MDGETRNHGECRYAMANTVQFRCLAQDLTELKERVRRLETAVSRGVALLLANLAGIVVMLLEQVLRS